LIDITDIFDTFNVVTVLTAAISGGLFGFFGLAPMIDALMPHTSTTLSPTRAAWLTFVVTIVIVGAVVSVFYVEQITTEILTGEPLVWRAVGRFITFAVFLLAFAGAAALDVYRTAKRATRGPDGH